MAEDKLEEKATAAADFEIKDDVASSGTKPRLGVEELGHGGDLLRRSGGRDLQVSALVHLLGLPTKDELKVLEKKVDLITNKLTTLGVKVDRLMTEMTQSDLSSALDRIDSQIADLRAVIKKVLPKAIVSGTESDSLSIGDDSMSRVSKVVK